MGNTKGKMAVQGEEANNGKQVPDVVAEDKAATADGASDAHAVVPETTDHKPESSSNGHATATGEESVCVADKPKDDIIEESPAAANDSICAADTTADSSATADSATKKKKESKPLVWLKQVKKHVSFSKKKKPVVVDTKAEVEECENCEPDVCLAEEPAAIEQQNVAETQHEPHAEESPKDVQVVPAPVSAAPVIAETPKENPVEDVPPVTTTPVVEVPASTTSAAEEHCHVSDQHVSSSNDNTTSASESHDDGTLLE